MTSAIFDTLASARRLKAHGISQEQAEAIAEEMRAAHDASRGELVTQIDLYTVKTELKTDAAAMKAELKADIADVRTEMAAMKAELKADIADVRTEMAAMKAELKADIADVRTEMAAMKAELIKWMFSGFLAMIGLQVAILMKLH